MNKRCMEDCDFCGTTYGKDKDIVHGVDLLRPFNPSFDQFLGIKEGKYNSYYFGEAIPSKTIVCKVCAKAIAKFTVTVDLPTPPLPL